MKLKKTKEFSRLFIREVSSFLRLNPKYIIIGTQKGGTTSLYSYLIEHPNILPAFKKEIHFFDNNFYKGMRWYRKHFPIRFYYQFKKYIYNQNFITGEASPDYMFNPFAAKKVYSVLPNLKIIVLLRNPVDRAYSHYHMNLRRGFETLSFENSIKKSLELNDKYKQRLLNSLIEKKKRDILFYPKYSYLSRGKYIEQIKTWFENFPKDNILIIRSEDFYNNIPQTLKIVLKFLDIPYWDGQKEFGVYNSGSNPKMNKKTRIFLINYFKPYNKSLNDYLGINFEWDK